MSASWHTQAKAMHATGVSVADIARAFGVTFSAAAFAVDWPNHRERHRQRCEKRRSARTEMGAA